MIIDYMRTHITLFLVNLIGLNNYQSLVIIIDDNDQSLGV